MCSPAARAPQLPSPPQGLCLRTPICCVCEGQPPRTTNRQPLTAYRQPPPTANNNELPTANRRQPPTVVQYCFCRFVSCPCLDHEAESVPVSVRFCWPYELDCCRAWPGLACVSTDIPCPSRTRRWFRRFLVIYHCVDKGGDTFAATVARAPKPPFGAAGAKTSRASTSPARPSRAPISPAPTSPRRT